MLPIVQSYAPKFSFDSARLWLHIASIVLIKTQQIFQWPWTSLLVGWST